MSMGERSDPHEPRLIGDILPEVLDKFGWDRDALAFELQRVAEARALLFEATRGMNLSVDALFELNHLMTEGSYEEIVAVLKHIRTV
jgi:hypothetical protein